MEYGSSSGSTVMELGMLMICGSITHSQRHTLCLPIVEADLGGPARQGNLRFR